MSITKGDEAVFKAAYGALNAAQREAVDTIDGPVMVIAGPGTGKTQILTLRIANILQKTDSKASNILALTFTESGARAMRERLKSLIGDSAYDVAIYTFHGFADTLIGRYPDAYPTIIGGRPASQVEKVQVIESILVDTSFKALRPSGDPSFYVQPILRAVQTLKQEYITVDDFGIAVETQVVALMDIPQFHEKGAHKGKERGEYKEAAKHLARNQELLMVYRLYESTLRTQKLYDFDDMIVETVRALSRDEDMLRDLQEQYHYVLADEHQDVNGSQNRILELLVNFHDRPNLFVVGDEKQAIYRFQGASLDNFLYFENTFGDTTTISLTDNYRSGQTILDLSHDLIKTDDEVLAPLRAPLTAAAVKTCVVESVNFSHAAIENSWIVDAIKKDIENGTPADGIAIILRTNREVEDFAVALRKQNIPAAPSADSDILQHPITHGVYRLLKAVAHSTDETTLTKLLHEPYWGVAVGDLAKILTAVSKTRSLTQILRSVTILKEIGVGDIPAMINITNTLDNVRAQSLLKSPHRLLEELLETSGFISHVLAADPYEGVRVVRRLFDEVEGMVKRNEVKELTDVVRRIDLHIQYGLSLDAPYIPFGHQAVQVMTAHKSKGLEFSVVYIPHVVDRTWGKKTSRDLFRLPVVKHAVGDFDVSEDDERRLLYVAMTRAKQRLVLSSSELNLDGVEQVSSRFTANLAQEHFKVISTESYSKNFSPVGDMKAMTPVPITTELILEVLTTRGFSPTALNNYLKSPWEYFYRNVLRVPQIKTTELQFGTAVHFVLDESVRLGGVTDVTKISELLKQSLNREAITDEEYTRLHERGLGALVAYTAHLVSTVTSTSKTEMKLEAAFETGIPQYPILKLNGTLDRVDYEDGRIVRVVDYKTGKPKTKGFIEGTTKDSTGDYKRQLVFYALLLSLQEDTDKHCRTGILSFVEPDTHGEIKEEQFTITDEEIAELKTELIRVTQEIVDGKALTVACDPELCHYCDLVSAWQQM